jgi:ferredoxin
MKIKLSKTLCDGFGTCAAHAPGLFALDEWGYASLMGDGSVSPDQEANAERAIINCPVHAISKEQGGRQPPTEAGEPGAPQ